MSEANVQITKFTEHRHTLKTLEWTIFILDIPWAFLLHQAEAKMLSLYTRYFII